MTTPPLNILDDDLSVAQHDGETHALALDITLVTNNMREFERVPGLRLESWV